MSATPSTWPRATAASAISSARCANFSFQLLTTSGDRMRGSAARTRVCSGGPISDIGLRVRRAPGLRMSLMPTPPSTVKRSKSLATMPASAWRVTA